MRCTDTAWPQVWMSLSRRLICRGTSARCTCDTLTGTCFGSAGALSPWGKSEGDFRFSVAQGNELVVLEKQTQVLQDALGVLAELRDIATQRPWRG